MPTPTQFVGHGSGVPPVLGTNFVLRSFDGRLIIDQAKSELLQDYSDRRGGAARTVAVAPGSTVEYYLCFDVPLNPPSLYVWYPDGGFEVKGFPFLALGP
ncbi:MAG: hypothetical protein ACTHMR_00815 [Thermomicrobiales bacterium]